MPMRPQLLGLGEASYQMLPSSLNDQAFNAWLNQYVIGKGSQVLTVTQAVGPDGQPRIAYQIQGFTEAPIIWGIAAAAAIIGFLIGKRKAA
jgi:hypothetical protein